MIPILLYLLYLATKFLLLCIPGLVYTTNWIYYSPTAIRLIHLTQHQPLYQLLSEPSDPLAVCGQQMSYRTDQGC